MSNEHRAIEIALDEAAISRVKDLLNTSTEKDLHLASLNYTLSLVTEVAQCKTTEVTIKALIAVLQDSTMIELS